MATYDIGFYAIDPSGLVPTFNGGTFVWSGSASYDGTATITDNEPGIQGTTLDDDNNGGETATADVTLGGLTSTNTPVDAEAVWTVQDLDSGEIFQIAVFDVEQGGASGFYTISEQPLVPGATYTVLAYDSNPNVNAGSPVFSYLDYEANNPSDNIVSGTAGDDTIDASYTGDPDGDQIDDGSGSGPTGNEDIVLAGAGDDIVSSGAGDDTVLGGGGADTIDGGTGDDTIYGDGTSEESLAWTDAGADNSDLSAGFTQTTGEIDVTVSFEDGSGNNSPLYEVNANGTGTESVYSAAGEPFDPNSSLYLYGTGQGETSTTTIDFAGAGGGTTEEVENVSFRISDIDAYPNNHTDVVTVNAYDAEGNPVAVTITPSGNDTVSGNTITAGNTLDDEGDAAGSVLIEIAGPVASIEIIYENTATPSGGYTGTHAIFVSDLHFEFVPEGDDVIAGGEGADTLYGGAGDDAITVAEGDSAEGGAGDDYFTITDYGEAGAGTITIDGGETGEVSGDTLDFNGLLDYGTLNLTNTDDAAGGLSGSASLIDGTVVNFTGIETIICFTEGTRILTPAGERAIETLEPGDLVITADHGPQPLRWIGKRRVAAEGNLAPVRINAGLFGNRRDLLVSPQHRMLYEGYQAQLLFGDHQVLVPARHLIDHHQVLEEPGGEVTYVHLMFDRHEIVFAEGARSESFHPGHVGLDAVLAPAREELFAVFPDLRSAPAAYGPTSRLCLKRYEAQMLGAA